MLLTLVLVATPLLGGLLFLTVVAETRRVTGGILDGYRITLEQSRRDALPTGPQAEPAAAAPSKMRLPSLDEAAEIPLVQRMLRRIRERVSGLEGGLLRKTLVHELIDYQVSQLLHVVRDALAAADFRSAMDARRSSFRIAPGNELAEENLEGAQQTVATIQRVGQHTVSQCQVQGFQPCAR